MGKVKIATRRIRFNREFDKTEFDISIAVLFIYAHRDYLTYKTNMYICNIVYIGLPGLILVAHVISLLFFIKSHIK